jgi:hypothetical protein
MFSFVLGVGINASGIKSQFLFSGEFVNTDERPPTQWNIKNDGQALPAWPSSAFIQILPQNLYALNDLAKHVPDCRTKDRQNNNDNDGDQHQNQCVLYKTLAFPLQFLEHGIFLLPKGISDSLWEFKLDYIIPHNRHKGRKLGIKLRSKIITFLKNG